MGVEASLQDLYRLSSLGKMAALMSVERSRLVSDAIDWPAERDIPHHVQTVIDTASVSNLSDSEFGNTGTLRQKREVVLTGATGFLGSEILRALLHDPSVSHIHCIAGSPGDQKQIQKFLGGSSRVFLYMGSLLSPTLGLSPDQIQYVQGCMSQIIHAGAQEHCLNNHTSLRSANLLSTQTLATSAIPRRVPLHFISSGRVIIQSGACQANAESMTAYPSPADGSEGFTASKWASEAFLENFRAHAHCLSSSTEPVQSSVIAQRPTTR